MRRAFTLIECLVVIMIVAILFAIFFPLFAQARQSARKYDCSKNVRQFGQAVSMYCSDYNGTFAPNVDRGTLSSTGKIITVFDLHQPYIGQANMGMLQCVSQPKPTDWPLMLDACGKPYFTTGNYRYVSYATNNCLFNPGDDKRPVWRVDELSHLNEIPVLYDGLLDCDLNGAIDPRHQNGINVVFADGHVMWKPAEFNPKDGVWVYREFGPYRDKRELKGVPSETGTLLCSPPRDSGRL